MACIPLLLFFRRLWFRKDGVLLDGIVRGDFKQCVVRLVAAEISQPVGRLTRARIAVLGHHDDLQFGGVPGFVNNFDGQDVADFTCGDGDSSARALS